MIFQASYNIVDKSKHIFGSKHHDNRNVIFGIFLLSRKEDPLI